MTAPTVEIVAIGNELLLGETVDTNGAWLGRRLAGDGIRVGRRTTVGDDAADIRSAVGAALDRTGVVLCTGGLGPTRDDLTKPVVAEMFGRDLVLDPELLAALERRFAERGIPMAENNRTQAEIPEGADVFPNPRGTAPALALTDERGRVAILLPGVPAEMRALTEAHVLPYLEARWAERGGPILHRTLHTTGIPESTLAARIDDVAAALEPLTLAYLPHFTGVDLRLTSWGELGEAEARRRLDAADRALSERIGGYLYGRDDEDLVTALSAALRERGFTLALAESCTGGLVAKRLTDPAGASDFLLAGVVAYANEAKEALLGVRTATLHDAGAVSEETAREMVEGVRARTGADCGISITGVAGPGGGSETKPVGTVWIAAAAGTRVEARRFRFSGDREEVRERSAQAALALLLELLREGGGA